ncbi:MAG: glycosyltransferase family 4 protein [Patescibacteria group bacterium]
MAATKPKIAFVIQRYGLEINGGAEFLCQKLAERMAKIWEIEIITTCANNYQTWENYYQPGAENINGIKVKRFSNDLRDLKKYEEASKALYQSNHPVSWAEFRQWGREAGPFSQELFDYIKTNAQNYDFFFFFTYAYATTLFGLELVAEKSFLVPFAHDDFLINLSVLENFFALPRAIIFSSPSEKRLLGQKFPNLNLKGELGGIGIDLPKNISPINFQKKYGLDGNYLLYLGRVDVGKNCQKLIDYFLQYLAETGRDLKLVLVGQIYMPTSNHPSILMPGFISEAEKNEALAGCLAVINPSIYESLSLILLEAWSFNCPTLVDAKCATTVDQSKRSQCGLWYNNYEEFKLGLEYIINHPDLAKNGQKFIRQNYSWEKIISAYQKVIENY